MVSNIECAYAVIVLKCPRVQYLKPKLFRLTYLHHSLIEGVSVLTNRMLALWLLFGRNLKSASKIRHCLLCFMFLCYYLIFLQWISIPYAGNQSVEFLIDFFKVVLESRFLIHD